MSGPAKMMAGPGGSLYVTLGYPDDGGTYLDVGPVDDVRGERVVWWENPGTHLYGYAVSDPIPGEHLNPNKPVAWRSAYWVRVLPDSEMPAHMRNEPVQLVIVPIRALWIIPQDAARTA